MANNDMSEDGRGAFLAYLATQNKGRSAVELDEALRELINSVRDTGKPGKLTYVVSVKPDPRVDGMVIVTDEIKATAPKFERKGDMWFVGATGELLRSDPHQHELFDNEGIRP